MLPPAAPVRGCHLSRGALLPTRAVAALVAAAAMTLGGVARAQVNNGTFDEVGGTLSSWGTFGNVIGNVSAQPLTPHGGTHVAKLFGQFDGGTNYAGLMQSGPAKAGQRWEATAWLRHNANDRLAGANRVEMKLEFYRSWGAAYGSADMLAEFSLTAIDAAALPDVWVQKTLQATAPAEAVEGRLAFVFVQSGNASGAALLDDVHLTADGWAPAPPGWVPIWGDEFDASTIEVSKWRVEDAFLWKNNELQYYAPDEVYTNNGKLVLRSRDRWYSGHPYTSGLVDTQGRFSHVYGRWEIRAKLPTTRGMWPAHWMLPVRPVWPPEIDIMEMTGDQPSRVVMSLHWGPLGPNGEPPWQIGQTANTTFWGPDFSADFHTFAIEWWPDALIWYVDGVQRFVAARPEVPDEPFYLILNTAVGGDWPGTPDGSTVFPQYHEIDYVRVYAHDNPGVGLAEVVDDAARGAAADGVLHEDEYVAGYPGINRGLFRQLGEGCSLKADSDGEGRVQFAFSSATAWGQAGPWHTVLYLDTRAGGFASTVEFVDAADAARRAASGRGASGAQAVLYFAPGFLADYALCAGPAEARLYELRRDSHVLAASAALAVGAAGADDALGYVLDDGTAGGKLREISVAQSLLGLSPGLPVRYFATRINGDTGFRSNEFVGVAAGNDFDDVNIGAARAMLKWGDFLSLTTAPRWGDADGDGHADLADHPALVECLAGPDDAPAPGAPYATQTCLNVFDFDGDDDVDLRDVAAIWSRYEG